MLSTLTYSCTDLPRVAATPEAYLASCPVGALSHGVAVKREPILFDVHVVARVPRVPRVIERAQLGFVRGNRAEEAGLERLLRQLPDAMHPPHVVVLVIKKSVPILAHQRTVAQVGELEV